MKIKNTSFLYLLILLVGCKNQNKPAYLDMTLSADERSADLVSQMTLEEKILQLSHLSPAIERLNVTAYDMNFDNPYGQISIEFENEDAAEYEQKRPWEKENWHHWEDMGLGCLDGGYWNEALHGVARSGLATVFPQAIGLGSTWNPDLIQSMADVTSTEARIHYNKYGKKLTYWSPTINILRDPRWGRNEESYGEDPYLLSRMAVGFVKGLQGNDPSYLKAVATVKHFVANNSEFNRHTGSSDVSERWLREYYLPAFKASIMEGGAMSVMSAYNSLNGIPASANTWLLDDVLRKEWGFKGYVVSDCGAISDIVHGHKFETDPERAVAMAVKAGTDLECETCGDEQFLYDKYLSGAFEKGYITEAEIDKAVARLFRARILLGEFDPAEKVPFSAIPESDLDSESHKQLALQVARESMVLLKNDGILPLNQEKLNSIAVIGPNANVAVLGGYSGTPSKEVSALEGIKEMVGDNVKVEFAKGCLISHHINEEEVSTEQLQEIESFDKEGELKKAVALAKNSDVAVVFVGTNLTVANEEADRSNLNLPGDQQKLVEAVCKVNKKVIVVLINGMSLTIDWIDNNVPGILEAWYPGQSGGTAIAEVLFGKYNPGGKLPVTFYKNLEDLPPIGDYDIAKGRTYMFFEGDVIYPFGHGLSYTNFEYGNLKVDGNNVTLDVQNTGDYQGDEVVQLYVRNLATPDVAQPMKKLRKFRRIHLDKGTSKTLDFTLDKSDFAYWDEHKKEWTVASGDYEILVGSSSADIRVKMSITR
ncbi:glycoside hydrolase family 3 C-terminal domain-containing protein [Flagellimonas sp. CMM7]|uniref:glycoside hydrolase family 3 C-terminal domain-containing protein n=1 Tax=Flagellimonas sp. CMM7 TaxID=2654676 RepID=UPI0013D5E7F4|nr:glycoside hydrolase family 3 C-terminal domain-containing protein [Flagellimonas sp. CMM7]UII79885.1 glycoside hydrolase family 3 C-terminal domain-containing protein [Flagellimonas sp. CMM7]